MFDLYIMLSCDHCCPTSKTLARAGLHAGLACILESCLGLGISSAHITSKSLGLLHKSHHRVSILIDLTVSRFWRGGIVQWFPDLINAGEKSRRGPKKGDKISDRISGSPGLTVGWPQVPVLCSPLCVRLLPANVIKLFYRLSG